MSDSDAGRPGYVGRMRAQYEATDEKVVLRRALDELFGSRRFARALDVGPGPGEVTGPLAARSDRLTLVELNAEYGDGLRAQYPNAELVLGSIHDRSYGPEFDAILFSHGLYYVPESEWRAMVDELVRWLTPGGSLFVVMNSNVGDMWDLARHFWPARPDTKTHSWKDWAEFKRELGHLDVRRTVARTYHWRFAAAEAVKFIGSSLLALSDPAVLAREAAEIEAFAQRFRRPDGAMEMTVGLEVLEIGRPGVESPGP